MKICPCRSGHYNLSSEPSTVDIRLTVKNTLEIIDGDHDGDIRFRDTYRYLKHL